MTRMNEVVEQIEMVIDDKEYPATLNELITLKKILVEITRQRLTETSFHNEFHPAAVVTPHYHPFPGIIYDLLRNYERQRYVLSFVRTDRAIQCNSFSSDTRSALSTG
ncbi:MAG: hypothetical protein WCE65_04750 [Methanoregula sp.]